MSLGTKVFSLLLAVLAVYAGIDYAVQRQVIFPSFVALEREEAIRNMERAIQAIQRELELLVPSSADWGNWDDTYAFMEGRDAQAYIDENLNAQSLMGLRIDLIAYYSLEGRRIHGLTLDPDTGEEFDANAVLPETLPRDHPLLTPASAREPISGLLDTPRGPELFASHPILTSTKGGPSKGNLIMGRRLNAAAMARIAGQTRIDLRLDPPDPVREGAFEFDHPGIRHAPIRITTGPAVLHATTTLIDLTGKPTLGLAVSLPRAITARGEEALWVANLSMGLAGGLTLVLLLLLLRHTVFRPVSRLTAHASAVAVHGDLGVRLNLVQRDEIGTLAREFDHMVARLAETRQRLLEQSYQAGIAYQSGIAEMASGVLHNIGNAITPLGVKLTHLKQALRDAPLEDIQRAQQELADPATPPERRADLRQFLELAAEELADILQRMTQELGVARTQVDHVEAILTDQRRFSRAARVLEPVAVQRLLTEALDLMPEHFQDVARVELDPRLAGLGPVRASRTALAQVIGNLLLNAAESIRATGQKADTGRIRVRLLDEPGDLPRGAHLCFEDNGQGIAPETLAQLFQRGFSTKNRGSGLGLHWSANTVSAMGGRLYAESAGLGQGACLHLHLPLADEHPLVPEDPA